MAHPFRAFEVDVLQSLLSGEFSRKELSQVLEGASGPDVQYTDYGFYVAVRHPAIGKVRRVYSGPPSLAGRCEGHTAGFIVFLEDDKLTLEIYPWDGQALPATFRDCPVRVGP